MLARLPKLRVIQLISAGAERAIPHVPAGVTLCNARGAHDPAVAEWIMAGLSTRMVPRVQAIVREQLTRYAAGEPLRNVIGAQGY